MRVRKLSSTGDYTFGQGQANFWINSPQGVGQNVMTRLLLWEGEWFLDQTIGTPWSQEVLGYNNASLRDVAIKTVIIGTVGVKTLQSYASNVNRATREFIVTASIITIFSPDPVTIGPVIL